MSKKKAIFIDGPSLHNICRILKIGRYKFWKFKQILKHEIGDCEDLANKPIYVLPEEYFQKLGHSLRNAGFDPVSVTTEGSRDDAFIRDKIGDLDPETISEIVLVSSDTGFVDCLLEKQKRNIDIFVVATEVVDPKDDHPVISDQMPDTFNFIELGKFRDEILIEEWKELGYSNGNSDGCEAQEITKAEPDNGYDKPKENTLELSAQLEIDDDPEIVGQVIATLAVLTKRFPSLEISFSGRNT